MIKTSSQNKNSRKGQGVINQKGKPKLPRHQTWSFKPRLKNEAIVLHSILDIYDISFYETIVLDIRSLITSLVRQHGFTDGAKRYNVIKNYTISLIELRNPTNPSWVSTSETFKIPSKLGETFIQLIVDNFKNTDASLRPKYYQVISTILNIVRMIEGLSDAEFDSITDKSKPIDEDLLQDFETYVSKMLAPYKYDSDSTSLKGYRFNLLKKGPNGKPKLESAHEEAVMLLDSKLSRPFRIFCEELGVSSLYDYLSALKEIPLETNNTQLTQEARTIFLRKLVSVPDSGFKTRIVAIVDFWSQLVLEPVRDHVINVTKQLFSNTDYRLNQDGGVAAMVAFQKRCLNEEVYKGHKMDIRSLMFYDISSWTDRFHRDLQKITMKHLFSPRLSESWAQLVVHCPWNVKGHVHTIQYGQGQGMGTNGSFDIATLTDHLFINFVIDKKSELSGIFPNNAIYGKVGDDLWIYDPEDLIRKYYAKINLPINLSKSKEYSELGSTAEFCSRTFLDGFDVSRISPRIINKSNDFRYIPTLLKVCSTRGVQLDRSHFTYLDNITKDGKETYFDVLQYWIIGMVCIDFMERGSTDPYLSLDYLERGHWLTEKTTSFLADQQNIERLAIAHCIMDIARSMTDIKIKAAEVFEEAPKWNWNDLNELLAKDLFNDLDASGVKEYLGIDRVLLPREIIIAQRFADQQNLVTQIPNGMLELSEDRYTPIQQLCKTLHQISFKSCYDSGNINYDVKKVYNTQFAIIKTLESLSSDLSVLYLNSSDDVRTVKQVLVNDLIDMGWGTELPSLCDDPELSQYPNLSWAARDDF